MVAKCQVSMHRLIAIHVANQNLTTSAETARGSWSEFCLPDSIHKPDTHASKQAPLLLALVPVTADIAPAYMIIGSTVSLLPKYPLQSNTIR